MQAALHCAIPPPPPSPGCQACLVVLSDHQQALPGRVSSGILGDLLDAWQGRGRVRPHGEQVHAKGRGRVRPHGEQVHAKGRGRVRPHGEQVHAPARAGLMCRQHARPGRPRCHSPPLCWPHVGTHPSRSSGTQGCCLQQTAGAREGGFLSTGESAWLLARASTPGHGTAHSQPCAQPVRFGRQLVFRQSGA